MRTFNPLHSKLFRFFQYHRNQTQWSVFRNHLRQLATLVSSWCMRGCSRERTTTGICSPTRRRPLASLAFSASDVPLILREEDGAHTSIHYFGYFIRQSRSRGSTYNSSSKSLFPVHPHYCRPLQKSSGDPGLPRRPSWLLGGSRQLEYGNRVRSGNTSLYDPVVENI